MLRNNYFINVDIFTPITTRIQSVIIRLAIHGYGIDVVRSFYRVISQWSSRYIWKEYILYKYLNRRMNWTCMLHCYSAYYQDCGSLYNHLCVCVQSLTALRNDDDNDRHLLYRGTNYKKKVAFYFSLPSILIKGP